MKELAAPLLLVFLSGCAGLSYRTADVSFEDPFTRLGITPSAPTAEEEAGVLLRMNPPAGEALRYREETKLYAQIKDNRGKEIHLNADRVETYKPTGKKDTFLIYAESTIDGHAGAVIEEAEVSSRGEILKFIRAHHDSKDGKFDATDWTRTPIFPEDPGKVGDVWNYQESMAVKVDSFWLKQKDNIPYKIEATSKLTGFAEMKGQRCAVIETEAKQIQTQRVKVLWKEFALYIQARIKETTYWDYKQGKALARIARVETYTNSADAAVNDHSIGQTVTYTV